MTQRSTKIFAENMEIVEVFDGIIEGAEFSNLVENQVYSFLSLPKKSLRSQKVLTLKNLINSAKKTSVYFVKILCVPCVKLFPARFFQFKHFSAIHRLEISTFFFLI
jgi:hypothetical protein